MHSCSSYRQEEISYFHRLTIQAASPWWLRWSRIWLQYRRPRFNPWVWKIPWRRKWQPTPVFLPGKSHGQWSLGGYSPWGCKESDRTERLAHTHTHIHTHTHTHVHSIWGKGFFLGNMEHLPSFFSAKECRVNLCKSALFSGCSCLWQFDFPECQAHSALSPLPGLSCNSDSHRLQANVGRGLLTGKRVASSWISSRT